LRSATGAGSTLLRITPRLAQKTRNIDLLHNHSENICTAINHSGTVTICMDSLSARERELERVRHCSEPVTVRGPRLGRKVQRRLDGRRGERRGGSAALELPNGFLRTPKSPIQPFTITCAFLETWGRDVSSRGNGTASKKATPPAHAGQAAARASDGGQLLLPRWPRVGQSFCCRPLFSVRAPRKKRSSPRQFKMATSPPCAYYEFGLIWLWNI
jgi:hypothetical protein